MGLTVPAAMDVVLKEADSSASTLDEGALESALMKARPDSKVTGPEDRTGAFAEIAAWSFMRSHSTECEPWGLYWGPFASGTLADGKTPFYRPDIAEIDEDILTLWITRAVNGKHPVIRARYADLAWEIGRYFKRPAKDRQHTPRPSITIDIPVSLAQTAIDGYLDAVERGLSENEHQSWNFLDRAIGLSISLSDKARTSRAKSALFAYYRKLASGNTKFRWARLADFTEGRTKALGLEEDDQKEITNSLEAALSRYSDISDKERFDPHEAMDAADYLVRRLGSDPEKVRSVVKRAGAAFEEIAKEASGILAISWLEDLIPRYRNAGLVEDAARVERAIRDRAEQARGEMKRISVPLDIPKEELDKWADAIAGSNLREALARIAWHCRSQEEHAQKSVLELAEKTPLLSMITATVVGADGFSQATIDSVEDDLEGRVIQHAADWFNWKAPFLSFAFNRAREKHGFDLNEIVTHINGALFFAPAREALLREGLAAWIAEDAVKAIHILVPQVEAACRDLLAALGAPVMKHDPKTGGFEVIGMGGVINHPAFQKGVPQDIRFHLRALYSDPRGINLRNHLAHGMAHVGLLGMGLANWVVQSILLLALLKIKERPAEESASESNIR